jgi:hypothetical protein
VTQRALPPPQIPYEIVTKSPRQIEKPKSENGLNQSEIIPPDSIPAAPLAIENLGKDSIGVRATTTEGYGQMVARIKDAVPGFKPLWNRTAEAWVFPARREPQVRAALGGLLGEAAQAPAVGEKPEPVAQPAAAAEVPVASFRTAQGSTYDVHGETTQRTKTLHKGHSPTDVGLKDRSERTVYVSPEDALKVGMHGSLSGPKTVFLRGDDVIPAAWNEAAGKWGVSPSDRGIKFTTTPEVGKAPIEVWGSKPDGSYAKWHAGNPITEVTAPESNQQDQPRISEPDQPAKPRRARPTRTKPQSLLEFIANTGGITDPQHAGELKQMGLDKYRVPFGGRLVRKNAPSLDYARERAAEAGYLPPRATSTT